jgi:hypothetical protein
MKSATPSFCISILLGGIMCLISTYFASLHTNDDQCAANAWLLTAGFTLMFA